MKITLNDNDLVGVEHVSLSLVHDVRNGNVLNNSAVAKAVIRRDMMRADAPDSATWEALKDISSADELEIEFKNRGATVYTVTLKDAFVHSCVLTGDDDDLQEALSINAGAMTVAGEDEVEYVRTNPLYAE